MEPIDRYLNMARGLRHNSPGTYYFVMPQVLEEGGSLVNGLFENSVSLKAWCPSPNYQSSSLPCSIEDWKQFGMIHITARGSASKCLMALSKVMEVNPSFDVGYALRMSAPRIDLAAMTALHYRKASNETPRVERHLIKDVTYRRMD